MNKNQLLENAACEVAKQSSKPPLIFELPSNTREKIFKKIAG